MPATASVTTHSTIVRRRTGAGYRPVVVRLDEDGRIVERWSVYEPAG
jgi:hypothetical protein